MEIDFSNSSKEEINYFYKIISNNVKNHRLKNNYSQYNALILKTQMKKRALEFRAFFPVLFY